MSNPPPLVFPVENKKGIQEVSHDSISKDNIIVSESIKNAVNKILNDAVPKEINKNHVSGGIGGSSKDYSYSFYNPHNARYYFDFSQWNFRPKLKEGVGRGRFKIINKSEWAFDEDFYGCRIVVKKSLIEVTNKVNKDRLFRIEGNSENRRLLTIEAVTTLEKECINALRLFIIEFGGSSSFVCKKVWIPDNKIYHDRVIDSLPSKLSFRNDVVKKVYLEEPSNVEYSDPAFASNYFRNMGLFDYGNEIMKQLDEVKSERVEFSKALALYTEQINLHLKVEERQLLVQEETMKTMKAIQEGLKVNNVLSDREERQQRARVLLKEFGW